MRPRALFLLFIVVLAAPAFTGAQTRTIQFTPEEPMVGQEVTFTAVNFATPKLLRWDMGDGTVTTVGAQAVPAEGARFTHAYKAAGTYIVKVYDNNANITKPPVSVSITVGAIPRYIRVKPSPAAVGQTITITAFNFHTPDRIVWELGDGTRVRPGDMRLLKESFMLGHRYTKAGEYTIKAYDDNGDTTRPPLTVTLTVSADPRALRCAVENPTVNQPILFRALEFRTPDNIRWDMGDGSIYPPPGGSNRAGALVNHTYRSPGSYVVKAYDHDGDTTQAPVTLTVSVLPSPASLAAPPEATAKSAPPPTETRPGREIAGESGREIKIGKTKTRPFLKLGPYLGFFRPNDAKVRDIYLKNTFNHGKEIVGGRIGLRIWDEIFLWLSYSRFHVKAQTTFTKEETELTLQPITATLRYSVPLGLLKPYVGVGYTYLQFKESSPLGNTKDNGGNACFELGFELFEGRGFGLDIGARYDRVNVKPTGEEIDLGGLQFGALFFLSF